MSLTDVLSVIAILVSFATFAFTAYEQYLKSAQIQLVLLEEIRLSYGYQFSDLGYWCPVATTNLGAVDAVVLHISGQVTGGRSWAALVEWQAFGSVDVDKQGEGLPSFRLADWAESFVATSRKMRTDWIYFRISPLPLANGKPDRIKPETEYSLQLYAEVPATRWTPRRNLDRRHAGNRLSGSWTGSFQLSADDVAYLENHCVADENGLIANSLIVKLSGTSGWLRPQSPTAPVTDRRAFDQLKVPRPST